MPCRASTDTVNAVRFDSVFTGDHQREVELVEPVARHRHADDAGGVLQEERDLLGRGRLGRHDEVALVLAVLVVDDDDDLAAADGGDRVLDPGERHYSLLGLQESLDVLGHDVDLQVDPLARALVTRAW